MPPFETQTLVIPAWVHERAFSHTCIPFVSAIFPEASLTAANMIEVLDRLDSHQILRVFVSQLTLDSKPQRRAVGDRQPFAVQVIGEDRLRMKGVDEINTFVVGICTHLQNVRTIKYDITRIGA